MKKNTQSNNLYFIKEIIKADKLRIPYDILVKVLQSIMGYILWLIIIKIVLNSIIEGEGFIYILIYLAVFELVEIIYIFIRSHFYDIYLPCSDNRIYKYFQKKIFDKSIEVDISCYEDSQFYDQYIKITSDIKERTSAIINSLSSIVTNLITLAIMGTVMFTIDSGIIIFVLIPFISTMVLGRTQKKMKFQQDMKLAEVSRKGDYVRRTFYLKDYSKEIKLSNIKNVLLKIFAEAMEDSRKLIKKYGRVLGFINYTIILTKDIICYLGACLYLGWKTIVYKSIQLGDAFIVIDSIRRIAESLQNVVDAYNQFMSHSRYIQNLRIFLEYEPKIKSTKNIEINKNDSHNISLNNVSFKYINSDRYSLKDINLEIAEGEKIALVGTNGAGKSTLVKLLLRLYDPTEGEILINNKDIKNYNIKSYRKLFGSVFQDFSIFSFSVLKNVVLDDKKLECEEIVEKALDSSGIYNQIMKTKNGIHTILTKEFDDNGHVFSGGEVQKIALARVFAKDSRIVILDEPSSALDPIAEAKMFEQMMSVCKDKTVIFISHRLSSTILADKVYFLESGKIIESGTHTELMNKDGRYAELFKIQSKYYTNKDTLMEVERYGN